MSFPEPEDQIFPVSPRELPLCHPSLHLPPSPSPPLPPPPAPPLSLPPPPRLPTPPPLPSPLHSGQDLPSSNVWKCSLCEINYATVKRKGLLHNNELCNACGIFFRSKFPKGTVPSHSEFGALKLARTNRRLKRTSQSSKTGLSNSTRNRPNKNTRAAFPTSFSAMTGEQYDKQHNTKFFLNRNVEEGIALPSQVVYPPRFTDETESKGVFSSATEGMAMQWTGKHSLHIMGELPTTIGVDLTDPFGATLEPSPDTDPGSYTANITRPPPPSEITHTEVSNHIRELEEQITQLKGELGKTSAERESVGFAISQLELYRNLALLGQGNVRSDMTDASSVPQKGATFPADEKGLLEEE